MMDGDFSDEDLIAVYTAGASAGSVTGEVLDDSDKSETELLEEIIERCMYNRVFFAEVVLGVVLETWQRNVLSDLDKGSTRVSIRSGNGAGKTCLLAIISIHYLLFRYDVKIPVTAPSSGQLKDGLIPECKKWMNELPSFLRSQIDSTQDRIFRVDSPENNFISFRTARKEKPEALQGIHATFVMCVVDEASGVDDVVYEAAQGTMSTPGAIFIMISNPTRLAGYFYNSQTRNRAQWSCFHVTAFDTSRVDVDFVRQIETDYGIKSDQYRVKIMGEFPTRDEQTLIGLDTVQPAFSRDISAIYDEIIVGVDVGRGGDLSALTCRAGNVMFGVKYQNYSDTMQTVGWVVDVVRNLKFKGKPVNQDIIRIYVDSIGIGAGVADRLRELGFDCVDINVSESSSSKQKYLRLRDELWWGLKKWFESATVRIDVEDVENEVKLQEMIESEVTSPLQLFTSSGKDAVETKQQMRQRGLKSPNIADSMCLTLAYDASIMLGAYSPQSSGWNKPLDLPDAAHVF